MPMTYLKTDPGQPSQTAADRADTVQVMLARLRSGGAQVALEYARTLDDWMGDITVTRDQITATSARVPQTLKEDKDWAHDNISALATAQRATAQDMQIELRPGLIADQRQIPLGAAGCYVAGGRHSHIASALISIANARVAGVVDITANPETVAPDLVGQAKHGVNSPVWLATTDRRLADAVLDRIPALPEPNRSATATSATG